MAKDTEKQTEKAEKTGLARGINKGHVRLTSFLGGLPWQTTAFQIHRTNESITPSSPASRAMSVSEKLRTARLTYCP